MLSADRVLQQLREYLWRVQLSNLTLNSTLLQNCLLFLLNFLARGQRVASHSRSCSNLPWFVWVARKLVDVDGACHLGTPLPA